MSAPGSGAAAPVVLVHGLGVSSRYMVPLAAWLAGDFQVNAVDLPGFGLSSKPEHPLPVAELAGALAAWLREVSLEDPLVVANSFGCQVVAELLAVHAPAVRGVVLLAPTVDPQARSILAHLWRWLLTIPWERPALARVIAEDYSDAGLRRVRQTAAFAQDDRIEDKLPRIEARALVVRGTRDAVVPQRWAEQAASLIPQGRLEVIRGAAHCLNFSAPERTAALVRAFAQESG